MKSPLDKALTHLKYNTVCMSIYSYIWKQILKIAPKIGTYNNGTNPTGA